MGRVERAVLFFLLGSLMLIQGIGYGEGHKDPEDVKCVQLFLQIGVGAMVYGMVLFFYTMITLLGLAAEQVAAIIKWLRLKTLRGRNL